MFILTLIGILIAGMFIYGFIEWFNSYTQEKAKYKFFTFGSSTAMTFSYVLMFSGGSHMLNAIHAHGDWLNGVLVILIGSGFLIRVIHYNFKNVPLKLAMQGTIAQILLYIPIAVIWVIIVAAMIAVSSETKPVYSINSRD